MLQLRHRVRGGGGEPGARADGAAGAVAPGAAACRSSAARSARGDRSAGHACRRPVVRACDSRPSGRSGAEVRCRGSSRPAADAAHAARGGGVRYRSRCLLAALRHPHGPSVRGRVHGVRKGWCPECVRRQGTAAICASCDALCVATADREAREARARQRTRPLLDEVGTILRYPFTDATAFVAFAVVVGVFSVLASIAAFGGGFGLLFSQGLLYAYAFRP